MVFFPKNYENSTFSVKNYDNRYLTLNSELEPKVFESELKYPSPDSDLNPKINDKAKKTF
jgi:hypothetical protein